MWPPASEVAPVSVALSEICAPTLTDWAAAVEIDVSFLTTVKHSVVWLVCLPARYCELASGVYSARKQYDPSAAGLNGTDVAVPPLALVVTLTALPSWVPPVEQSGAEPAGPHRKKRMTPEAGAAPPARGAGVGAG